MLLFGLFQLAFGPLADRFGKLRVIMGTMSMPVSLALIGDMVPLENRQIAIGIFMGISFLCSQAHVTSYSSNRKFLG